MSNNDDKLIDAAISSSKKEQQNKKQIIKYCKKCGAEINENDEFCRKCGVKAVLETFLFDKKLIIIQSFYLALGSISLYLFLDYLITLVYYSSFEWYDTYDVAPIQIYIILTLLAGIFLIFAYYGFLHQKKRLYPRFTGVVGCGLFFANLLYTIYETVTGEYFVLGEQWLVILLPCILLVLSMIFLFATLICWERLI